MTYNVTKYYKGDPYWTTVKYPAKCTNCGKQLAVGEKMFYYPRTKSTLCAGACGRTAYHDFMGSAEAEEYYAGSRRAVAPKKKNTTRKTKRATTTRRRDTIINSLAQKLNPRGYSNMSPKMAAIVGYIIGVEYTTPSIVGMVRTFDNHVMAMQSGDVGYNIYIGDYPTLVANWGALLQIADLSKQELETARRLFNSKIERV